MPSEAGTRRLLLTFDAPADDGFGGLVDSLFQNMPALQAALSAVLPQSPAPAQHGNAGI